MKYSKLPNNELDELITTELDRGDIKVLENGRSYYSVVKKHYDGRILVNEVPRDIKEIRKFDGIVLGDKIYVRESGYISKRLQ